jgi:hypothetical protein
VILNMAATWEELARSREKMLKAAEADNQAASDKPG